MKPFKTFCPRFYIDIETSVYDLNDEKSYNKVKLLLLKKEGR